ncbi:MAG TPA: hypothetical protein VLF43_03070 [Candidatus Saccharimonadales bacterium]|nr:hypothetical protein [Candidatus Saccharimonadales bacterium]
MAKPLTRKKTTAKKPTAKPAPTPIKKHTSFRLEHKVKRDDATKLPSSFQLLKQALQVLWQHRGLFLCIVAVLVVLELSLAGALITRDHFSKAKESVDMSGGLLGGIGGGFTLLVYMFSLSGQGGNPAGAIYQMIILTILSLAMLYALRHVYGKDTAPITMRDAFYRGMYPLVPYVLVLVVIIAELLPLAMGVGLYTVITANGLATSFLEQLLWVPLSLALAVLSLYLLASTVFGLYIATLPDMTPMRALRSAREFVAARRFAVIRKLLFIPFALLMITALIVVPSILFLGWAAPMIFFAITMLLFPIGHSYMYALYRALL